MASKKIAKKAARKKARQVYKTNIKKPKKQVVKKFSNFVGKTTFKVVKARRSTRRKGGKSRRRR